MSDELYDVIVIGAGPAGLTTGIYTSRQKYSTLILEGKKVGGKALDATWIENYPGFPEGVNGFEIMTKMEKQAKKFGVEIKIDTVYAISKFDDNILVLTRSNAVYKTKTLVIATGVSRKSLGIKGENEFKGRGVSYCSVCDGPFFLGKKVAVIGSGHEAIHDVEILSKTAKKVYAIPNGKGYNENYSELKILKNDPKIEFLHDTYVTEIKGTDFVESIKLEGNEPNEIKVDGVFLITEHIPVSKILSSASIETDAGGCIIVDKDQKTNIPGVFAAGDCCCKGFQIVTATGMGACAALNAMKYIKQLT
ncbi:FAD-dependent oxidoreductase [Candidatus Bathyarchaeota archaeon]|nr:FAD-dependent oxidoreductase [Candidatus Bathyarchaeota archaeon]